MPKASKTEANRKRGRKAAGVLLLLSRKGEKKARAAAEAGVDQAVAAASRRGSESRRAALLAAVVLASRELAERVGKAVAGARGEAREGARRALAAELRALGIDAPRTVAGARQGARASEVEAVDGIAASRKALEKVAAGSPYRAAGGGVAEDAAVVDALRGQAAADALAASWRASAVVASSRAQRKGEDVARAVEGTRARVARGAELAARNEVAEAYGSTRLGAIRDAALNDEAFADRLRAGRVVRVWESALEARTCRPCERHHGDVTDVDGDFPGGDEPGEMHAHCLPGDTLVVPAGELVGTTERLFEGEVVVIRTAAGHLLRATPNHPILTGDGWVAAGMLHEGGCVLSRLFPESFVADVHDEKVPTSIEKVARTFDRACLVAAIEVPVAAEDFHGDGVGSKVAIVRSDRLLRHEFDGAGAKPSPERRFVLGDDAESRLAPERHSLQSIGGASFASHGGVGGSDDLLPVSGVGPGVPEQVLSSGVASQRHTSGEQVPVDGLSTYAVPTREEIRRLAGEVGLDEIVEIRRESFLGHVFNLQTSSGWYVAAGIITHNCLCTWYLSTE